MKPTFVVNRIWNNQPIRITVYNWTVAQALKECSDEELNEYLSNKMILG